MQDDDCPPAPGRFTSIAAYGRGVPRQQHYRWTLTERELQPCTEPGAIDHSAVALECSQIEPRQG